MLAPVFTLHELTHERSSLQAGAINAFQTRMVPANQQAVQYQETDLIGVHTSSFVGSSSSGSTVPLVAPPSKRLFINRLTPRPQHRQDVQPERFQDFRHGPQPHHQGYHPERQPGRVGAP